MTESTNGAGGTEPAVGYHLSSCDSTQPLAHAWLARTTLDAPARVVAVLTDQQQDGQGREGRSWQNAPGTSLLLSVGLQGPFGVAALDGLPLRVAEATAGVLRAEYGVEVIAAAPNDLLVGTDKVGGVLLDSRTMGDTVEQVVVGIGVNISGEPFEADGRSATTLTAAGGTSERQPRQLADDLVPAMGELIGLHVQPVRWRQPARLWLALGSDE